VPSIETVMSGVEAGGPGSTQPYFLPRFAAVETLQRKQDLTSLTLKGRLIAAQPVKRISRRLDRRTKDRVRSSDLQALRLVGQDQECCHWFRRHPAACPRYTLSIVSWRF
jgi:hypothetical protein